MFNKGVSSSRPYRLVREDYNSWVGSCYSSGTGCQVWGYKCGTWSMWRVMSLQLRLLGATAPTILWSLASAIGVTQWLQWLLGPSVVPLGPVTKDQDRQGWWLELVIYTHSVAGVSVAAEASGRHIHSIGDQGGQHGLGPTSGSLAAVNKLSRGRLLSLKLCVLQLRLTTGIRCTAGVASPECLHGGGVGGGWGVIGWYFILMQPQKPKLAVGAFTGFCLGRGRQRECR